MAGVSHTKRQRITSLLIQFIHWPGRFSAGIRLQRVAYAMLLVGLGGCGVGSTETAPPSTSVRWKVNVPFGGGFPGAAEGYVIARDTLGYVHAYNATDGSERWRRLAPAGTVWDIEGSDNTVVIAAGHLYGYDASTGTSKWDYDTSEGLGELPFSAGSGLIFPSVYRGTGYAIALSAATGTVAWRQLILPLDSTFAAGDQVRIYGCATDGAQIAVSYVWWHGASAKPRGGVAVLNAGDGKRVWSRMFPVRDATLSTFPSVPAMKAGMVLISVEDGTVFSVRQSDGSIAWSLPPLSSQQAGSGDDRPVGSNGTTAIIGSGIGTLLGVDAATGVQRWRSEPGEGAELVRIRMGGTSAILQHLNGVISVVDVASGNVRQKFGPQPSRFTSTKNDLDDFYIAGLAGLWAIRAP